MDLLHVLADDRLMLNAEDLFCFMPGNLHQFMHAANQPQCP